MGGSAIYWSCLLTFFSVVDGRKSFTITEYMNKDRCEKYEKRVIEISEKKSAVILGKTSEPVDACKIKFGLPPNLTDAHIKLTFDFLYIHDCGVTLTVNESSNAAFSVSPSNQQIFRSTCHTRIPGPLHAQPRNFVLLKLYKQRESLEAFNFRIHVSVAESLGVTGPATHTLFIVGLIAIVVNGMALSMFCKYLTHVTQSWNARRMENTLDRAISIYNSREPLQSGNSADGPLTRNRGREPEIAFVYPDGRVDRFRPLDSRSTSSQSANGEHRTTTTRPATGRSRIADPDRGHNRSGPASTREAGVLHETTARSSRLRQRPVESDDTSSLAGCELPPSYEEALGMPAPASKLTEIVSNVDGSLPARSDVDNEDRGEVQESAGAMHQSAQSEQAAYNCDADVAYANVAPLVTSDRTLEEECDSEAPLLVSSSVNNESA